MKHGISIIGAGRIGRALGRRLRENGWKIHGVVTKNPATARRAARAIGDGKAYSSLTRDALSARVLLIAVPESAIDRVVSQLASFGRSTLAAKTVLYTSGALGSEVLAPLRAHGAALGTMHPLQTFSAVGIPALDGRLFVLEGDTAALRDARSITRSLGGRAVQLKTSDKPLYHAAAVIACGQILALAETSVRILASLGMKRREALKSLLPLTRQVLENLERVGPRAAWTGPLARGDFQVIEKHQLALRSVPAEFLTAYNAVNHLAARVLSRDPAAALRALRAVEHSEEFQSRATGVTA